MNGVEESLKRLCDKFRDDIDMLLNIDGIMTFKPKSPI